MRLMVTHLRTTKNEEIVVPNSVVLQSHVVNYSKLAKTHGLILHTTVSHRLRDPVATGRSDAAARPPSVPTGC